ncbi:nuclear pore complex protein Nup205-like isoform X2 [Saccostrea echinata]|uniref:nuclear pore complex protein Nup205-like isoform X2 n=1 Tax=Saccostrea echinata TaxID=191078 RepID=UPI002A80A4AE|nr:nuclear pore complex protein Nup205-like isoform X2 [Saccostrea echinata]
MAAGGMAVNSEARLWGPFKELEQTVHAAIHRKIPDAIHDLEIALKKHKPDFIALLKNPPKNAMYRTAVRNSTKEGLPVMGDQTKQTFSQQFIEEALILSDLFDMSEIAAVELLMAGERQQAEFPGLTRGLVAVLLYYDGQKSLVNSLRTLLQSREGRMWTMELTPDLSSMVNQYTDQLIQKDRLINTILDQLNNMDLTKEMDRLQRDRAIGPPKHKKQVSDLYREIQIILADCLFCLATQQPLEKADTLRLIQHLRADNSLSADGTLDPVSLCLLMALLYCFDVSLLEHEDGREILQRLPMMTDSTYIPDIHQDLMSTRAWANPGLKSVVLLAWGVTLRQLNQYQTPTGVNGICEEDEVVINEALEANVFHFLRLAVVAVHDFHKEEYYLKKIHGLITDFIFHMPLKVKELRTRGDEAARIAASQSSLEPPTSPSHGFQYLLRLIGDLYRTDPLCLRLSVEYWCPQDNYGPHETMYNVRPPQRQVSLYKFVRLAGDLLPPSLYVPYIQMLIGLSSNPQSAHYCFDLLKVNGMGSGGPASAVSWQHIFLSLNQYYASLRREVPSGADMSHMGLRGPHPRGITPQELEGLVVVLKLCRVVSENNENCRVAFCENQQWQVAVVLFGLVTCSIPLDLKAEIFRVLAAFAKTPDVAASLWHMLEASQILTTVQSSSSSQSGIQVELEEVETRAEEFPMTRAFLSLLDSLTDIPVPPGLGAGLRAPGFQPYLEFVKDNVFEKFYARSYKNPSEKWEVASDCVRILCKLLREYEVVGSDFGEEFVEVQMGGIVPANKSPGYILMLHLLKDSHFLSTVLKILDDSVRQLETYKTIPGQEALESASLLCLQLIETSLEKSGTFLDACRETGASAMVSAMDRLLLSINPRSGKADHLVNVTKFIQFSIPLPEHAQSAMKILYRVCHSAPVQVALVNLFTSNQTSHLELLHGFVECLEVEEPEQMVEKTIHLPEEEDDSREIGHVRNSTRQYLLQVLLRSLDQPSPNLAHLLLGFDIRKSVNRTLLQDPGILGSPKTCLHAVLSLLERGVGTHSGPTCLRDTPRLSELAYKLIYLLAANRETSTPTLRYLRTTRDFLYRQLQHLPFTQQFYKRPVMISQSWLLKLIAIELRLTALNRQRSHTLRLMKALLDDGSEGQTVLQPAIGDEADLTYDRFTDQSLQTSYLSQTARPFRSRQVRRKLLGLLDEVDFSQRYPPTMQLEFFELSMIEQAIKSVETRTEQDVLYCDVKRLHCVLMNELNNYQGNIMVTQRPRVLEEVENILQHVVLRNRIRQELYTKQQALEAWRQVTEVLLTACPEDLLTAEDRQTVLFELLQELQRKVTEDDALTELTAPVAGIILTLMTNLRQCFCQDSVTDEETSQFLTMLDSTVGQGQTGSWGQVSGSRTQFASSLQLVLRGVIDHILLSKAGGDGVGKRILADAHSEYEQLRRENVATILSYGDNFMDMVCRDACDGHDVGRMLALSVLDTILSMDKFQQWMTFMSSKGYLQHLVDSLLHDDQQLQTLVSATPQLRVLYIYLSKLSLLTRVAESAVGAHTLLQCGVMQRLAGCVFFDLRPDFDRDEAGVDTEEDFLPSPMARYRQLLFAALKFCLAMLTSLGIENQDCGNQVMQFILSHGEVFHGILRDRQPSLRLPALRELALTTAVLTRANARGIPDAEFDDLDPAGIELKGQKVRIERQMLALMPKYCISERVNKQLKLLESDESTRGRDLSSELAVVFLEVSSNVTSYCRAVISTSGPTSQFSRVLFRPSLDEALARDLGSTDDTSFLSISTVQAPSLGVVVYQLRQCATHFMSVYESHKQHLRKLQSLADLSTDDLKQFSGVEEKLTSHQRQKLAKNRLTKIVRYKEEQLQYFAYILENCLFMLWRHLEYYLIHCVPVNQQTSVYQSQTRRHTQLRRLQDLTGISHSSLGESESESLPDIDRQLMMGVTSEDIETLKQTANSAIHDSLLKKIQKIDQEYCKSRTHYSFVEALIRRVRRLLRLNTGS